MITQCTNPQCATKFEIKDSLVPPGSKRKLLCAYCHTEFLATRPSDGESDLASFENNSSALYAERPLVLNLRNRLNANPFQAKNESPPTNPPEQEDQTNSDEVTLLNQNKSFCELPNQTEMATKSSVGIRIMYPKGKKAVIFSKLNWLPSLGPQEVMALVDYMEIIRVDEGCVIYKKGEHNPFMGLVLVGQVSLVSDPLPEKQADHPPILLGEGQSFGEVSLLSNYHRESFAIATQKSFFFLLTKKRFHFMFETHPTLWRILTDKLTSMLVKRIHTLDPNSFECLSYYAGNKP